MRQTSLVGRAQANRVAGLRLEVEGGRSLQRITLNRETGVVGVAAASHQRVAEGVSGVGIGRAQCADQYSHPLVLSDRRTSEPDVGRSVILIGDADREDLVEGQASLVGRPHADRVAALGFEVEGGGRLQRTIVNREAGVVGVAGASHQRVGEVVAGIGVRRAERTNGRPHRHIFRHRRCRQREIDGRLILICDADREDLVARQASLVGCPHANRVAGLRLEVEGGRSLQRIPLNREAGVVGVAAASHQRVGESVADIGV